MTRLRAVLILSCLVWCGTAARPANAQTTPFDTLRTETAREIQAGPSTPPSVRTLDLANDQMYVAMVALQESNLLRLLIQYEEERADKQIGATASAPGTTTLISKGTVPKILGLAVENGAVTESRSGTTVTFRGNLGGAVRSLAGHGLFQLTAGDDPALGLLSRASISTTFDTSRGNEAADGAFTADRQQLSQWTLRWQIVNQRDAQGSRARERWHSQLNASQVRLAQGTRLLNQRLTDDEAVQTWLKDTAGKVAAAKAAATTAGKNAAGVAADIEAVLKAQEPSFPVAQLQPDTLSALAAWDQSASVFTTARHDFLQNLKTGALASFEYTNDRPIKGPKTSNLRLVAEVGGSVDLTGNASLTLFDGDIPAGASGRVRDFQLGGELDIKMGSAETIGAFVLALSGKFVRQLENSYSNLGVVIPDTKGTTAIGQLKLTVPAKGTGAKIPLSVTFANRTDLVKESIVRANVGVTYDLDLLFARFRP